MSRINIDDSIYRDFRFIKLIGVVGDYHKALGLMVAAWSLAQKHYINEENDRLIPLEDWDRSPFLIILEIGLAKKFEKGIHLCGAHEEFSWLLQRQYAGKMSALSRKRKESNGGSTKSNDRSIPFNENQRLRYGTQPPTPTPTPTPLTTTKTNSCLEFEKGFNPEIDNCRDYFAAEFPSIVFKKPIWIKIVDRFKSKQRFKIFCDNFLADDLLIPKGQNELQNMLADKILTAAGIK